MKNKSSIITIVGISSLAALKKIGSANFGDIPEDSVLSMIWIVSISIAAKIASH